MQKVFPVNGRQLAAFLIREGLSATAFAADRKLSKKNVERALRGDTMYLVTIGEIAAAFRKTRVTADMLISGEFPRPVFPPFRIRVKLGGIERTDADDKTVLSQVLEAIFQARSEVGSSELELTAVRTGCMEIEFAVTERAARAILDAFAAGKLAEAGVTEVRGDGVRFETYRFFADAGLHGFRCRARVVFEGPTGAGEDHAASLDRLKLLYETAKMTDGLDVTLTRAGGVAAELDLSLADLGRLKEVYRAGKVRELGVAELWELVLSPEMRRALEEYKVTQYDFGDRMFGWMMLFFASLSLAGFVSALVSPSQFVNSIGYLFVLGMCLFFFIFSMVRYYLWRYVPGGRD